MRSITVLFLLFSGCGGSPEKCAEKDTRCHNPESLLLFNDMQWQAAPDHVHEAIESVWYGTYGMISLPPYTNWAISNCAVGPYLGGTFDNVGHTNTGCYGGISYPGNSDNYVVWNNESIWHSGFAHELMHERYFLLTGDGDAAHKGADWDVNGLMWKAVSELKVVEESL